MGTEAREGDKKNLLRDLGELERPRGGLKAVTFPENWIKAVAAEELQGMNWEKEKEEEMKNALQWMDMPQTLMGVAPGDSERTMVGAGMGEGTARKIREQTEQWMLEEYHRDATLKKQCCRKERGRRRRQENKMKKRQMTAERKRKQAIRGNTGKALKRRRREIVKQRKKRVEDRRDQSPEQENRRTQKRSRNWLSHKLQPSGEGEYCGRNKTRTEKKNKDKNKYGTSTGE